MMSVMKLLSFFTLVNAPVASADEFLGAAYKHHAHNPGSVQAAKKEMQVALDAVLHCGSETGDNSALLASVQKSLLPVWQSLPKDEAGKVEWKLLRYVSHRYFMQRFGVLMRGLEPMLLANASKGGEVDVLRHHAPELAQRFAGADQGFSLQEATAMVAALERLLFESERSLLEKLYAEKGFSPQQRLTRQQLNSVMVEFMVYWMFGEEDARDIFTESTWEKVAAESIPHWDDIRFMVEGTVLATDFAKRSAPRSGDAEALFSNTNGFEDALSVAGRIGRDFSSFWNSQCQASKESLTAMDFTGTGRVKLSDFYGANQDGEWRFSESESYLRELGALDETGRGKQVLIANYMQGASNCIVMREHYLVCCMNECESILVDFENAVGKPMAEVDTVLSVLRNMTDPSGESIAVSENLRARLMQIAERHDGQIPLHGRLFAQWLHYVFPRECIFPHAAGTVAALTPGQFGDQYLATAEEMSKHVEGGLQNASLEDMSWMTQWSDEEELLTDYVYAQQLGGGRAEKRIMAVGGLAMALALLWVALGRSAGALSSAMTEKVHIV